MRRLVMYMAFAAAVLLSAAGTTTTMAASPVFGTAKVQTLDTKQMASVVGKNTTSAYYAYLGNFYANVAIQYASYGMYLESFGAGSYVSTRDSYYYNAYYNSYLATGYYYNAYLYN